MMRQWLRLFATLVALALIGTAAAYAEQTAEVGKTAPDFELTLLSGETYKLSDQRGKVVFLNIWAAWCPPCVGEMDDIQKLADAYPDQLSVIGASCDDDEADVRAFVEREGYTYPIAMDEGFLLAARLYPTQYIPESVFIGPDGNVVSIDTGSASFEEMERRFRAALGE